jgi:GntR family transcriptional regulator
MIPPFHIDTNHPMPLHAQLDRAIRFAITTGTLRTGDQLPTVRQMAVDLRVNANTVAKVYAVLEREGVVETRRGVGTFVLPPAPAANPGLRRRSFDAERQLNSLTHRFLADAVALGFSPAEVLEHLAGLVNKGE